MNTRNNFLANIKNKKLFHDIDCILLVTQGSRSKLRTEKISGVAVHKKRNTRSPVLKSVLNIGKYLSPVLTNAHSPFRRPGTSSWD